MDDQVLAAMARWPNVPDVFGWLSLSEHGVWRLHPQGNATDADGDAGESITSPQIIAFVGRNYGSDADGRWFFQNGPQRVFVRLDAAPFLLRTVFSDDAQCLRLQTHNGLAVRHVMQWWLDDAGKLYAMTEHGAGLVAGRDLTEVIDHLVTADGRDLVEVLDAAPGAPTPDHTIQIRRMAARHADSGAAPGTANHGVAPAMETLPLRFCAAGDVPRLLGFQRCPRPSS